MAPAGAPGPSPGGTPYLAPLDEGSERLAFLAEATTLLSRSLELDTTLTNLAQLAVPALADWCAVSILEADGSIRRLAVVHGDPERAALAEQLRDSHPTDPAAQTGVSQVIRTGQSQLFPHVDDDLLVATANNDTYLALMRDLGFRSAMLVPLAARGRVIGAMTFVAGDSGRRYTTADLAFAEDLAWRAAIAVDNARLHSQARSAEDRHRRLVESLRGIEWEADPSTSCFTAVGERAVEVLGYPVTRWREPGFWSAICVDPERAGPFELDAPGDHEVRCAVRASDGRIVRLRNLVHPDRDPSGRVVHLHGVLLEDEREVRAPGEP